MFKRVLLISPPSSSFLGAVRPPEGVGYLMQTLHDAGIECAIEDMRTRSNMSNLWERIRSFKPDLIGVSLISYEYNRSHDLIRQIKRSHPSIPVVVGGPHVSVFGATVLKQCSEIDFGVTYDGEHPLLQLCQQQSTYSDIPGLIFRNHGLIEAGRRAEYVENLDWVPFPRFVGLDLKRYVQERNIVTSRGCPFRCTFCPNSLIGRKFRARSPENVVDELEYWYERGIRMFNINDDNFTLIKERVYGICDDIERRGLTGLFIRCANGLRADKVDRDLLARMQQVGVREVAFGADGGNDRVLRDIVHKGETIADIERAIRNACELGLEVKLFVIVGHPGETMDDIEDSIALAQRYPVAWVYLNNPIPYPGTQLYETVRTNGLFVIPPDQYLNTTVETDDTPVFQTPELPLAVRRQVIARCRKVERLVKRRAVIRMMAGYPILRTLAGYLFASSVGQHLFFKNMVVRSLANRVWYHLLSKRQSAKGVPLQHVHTHY